MICMTCGKPGGHTDGTTCAGSKTATDPIGATGGIR